MNADPQLAVDSATGLQINLTIAGPGARSYAFIIDAHIRFIVGAAWCIAAGYFLGASFTSVGPSLERFMLVAVLPAFAIYFLYHPVVEVAMHGRTPGKRVAGVRIVTREGLTPGVGALLIRNVFRLIDALPTLYCVGLACTVFTKDQVRIGDMAAGTLLVYDRVDGRSGKRDFAPELAGGKIAPQLAEVIDDVLERWPTLERAHRIDLGQKLMRRIDPDTAPSDDPKVLHQQLRDALK